MFDQDEYATVIKSRLVPIDDAPLPTVSAWIRYYVLYCLATWAIGALLVWSLFHA